MAFNTFSGLQKQNSLQIIQYEGPPKPKQRSQQPPSKDEVEIVDLTGLGRHPNS
jgi:hypothetical protein